ncbi:MAG: hypothetical protein M3135_00060 [Actinomycetota bacterium]|nr:hypothetical protein [Actinomycetota bacterium]
MAVVLIVVAVFTAGAAFILIAGLIRRLIRLNTSVTRLQRDLVPVLGEIQEQAMDAQRRAAVVQERAASLAPGEG